MRGRFVTVLCLGPSPDSGCREMWSCRRCAGYHDEQGTNMARYEYLAAHITGAVWFEIVSRLGEYQEVGELLGNVLAA